MQLVPANVTYRIRLLTTGEEVVMSDDVWPYFRSLHAMTMDCDVDVGALEKGCVVEIPLIEGGGVEIDAALLQRMIDFYSVRLVEGQYGARVEMRARDQWSQILTDEETMIRLVKAADYLHTSELLVFVIDELHDDMWRQSFAYLEKRAASLTKRKRDDDDKNLRRQYRRELLVQRIMESLLPDNKFVKGIDTSIQKRINPIITSHGYDKTIVLQYGVDSVLIDDSYWSSIAITPESKRALTRARTAVYAHGHNEMVAGVLFYALLDREGLLTMYGEYGAIFEESIKQKPLGNQPVLAMWAGQQHLFVLTHDALYVLGEGDMYQVEGIEAWTVLDVSVGAQHALILTRVGLYGWGSNRFNQLGLGNTPPERGVVLIRYEEEQYFALRILCRDDHSVILMNDRRQLIGAGTRRPRERKVMGFPYNEEEYMHMQPELSRIGSYEAFDGTGLENLSGGSQATIIFGSSSILINTDKWYKGVVDKLPLPLNGIEVLDDAAIIVETGEAFFLINVDDMSLLPRLGGSDSIKEPYRLNLPLASGIEEGEDTGKKEEEQQQQPPKKKGRFGSCHMCNAKAKLVDMKSTTFFCSRYCFHKALIIT